MLLPPLLQPKIAHQPVIQLLIVVARRIKLHIAEMSGRNQSGFWIVMEWAEQVFIAADDFYFYRVGALFDKFRHINAVRLKTNDTRMLTIDVHCGYSSRPFAKFNTVGAGIGYIERSGV